VQVYTPTIVLASDRKKKRGRVWGSAARGGKKEKSKVRALGMERNMRALGQDKGNGEVRRGRPSPKV